MTLLNKLIYKAKYFWNTFRVKDYENTTVEVPYLDENDEEQVCTVHMPGYMYKTFMHVALTLQLDDRWTEDHIQALAGYLVSYPNDIDEDILKAFLHPEFYDALLEPEFIIEEDEE